MFSKSKRFGDKKLDGPAPGQYDPGADVTVRGPASFLKADRFAKDQSPVRSGEGDDGKENSMPPPATPLLRRNSTLRGRNTVTPVIRSSSSTGDLASSTNSEEVKRLLAEQKKLMDKLKVKDEELAGVKAELKELSGQAAKAQFEKDALSTDVELLRNTVSIFQQQKNEAANNLLSVTSFHDAVESENGQLHGMLSNLREEYDALAADKTKLETELQSCQAELAGGHSQCEAAKGMQERLQQLDGERAELTAQCTDLQQRLKHVTRQLEAEIRQSSVLAAHCASADLRVSSLEDILQSQCGKLRSCASEMEEQQGTNKKLRHTVDSLDLQLGTMTADHREALQEYEHKLTDVQGAVLQYQLDLQTSERRAGELEATVETHIVRLTLMEQEQTARHEAHAAYQLDTGDQLAGYQQQLSELEEQLRSRAADLEHFKSRSMTTESELVEARCELEQAGNESQNWKQNYNKCSHQLDVLEGDKAVLRQTLSEVRAAGSLAEREHEQQLVESNTETERLQSELDDYQGQLSDLQSAHQTQLEEAERRAQRVNQELSRRLIESEKRLTQSELDHDQECRQLSEKVRELTGQLQLAEAQQEENSDADKWRQAYETLHEQCAPFLSQLEMFSAEKQLLESQTSLAKSEMEELNRRYGELLGHQNQKQKIKHIMKMKEENLSMKQELMRLREQCDRQRKVIRQQEEKSRLSAVVSSGRKALAASAQLNVGLTPVAGKSTAGRHRAVGNESQENALPPLAL